MSSIMRCRSGLMALSVMRDAPVLMKVANPSSQDRTAPPRYRVGWVARRSALPRERFSPLAPKRTFLPDRDPSGCRYAQIIQLGACLDSRFSILGESDSTLGHEQVFSPLEYRSDAASAAECAGLRAERPCLAVYR